MAIVAPPRLSLKLESAAPRRDINAAFFSQDMLSKTKANTSAAKARRRVAAWGAVFNVIVPRSTPAQSV
jgi:hypothetical protein